MWGSAPLLTWEVCARAWSLESTFGNPHPENGEKGLASFRLYDLSPEVPKEAGLWYFHFRISVSALFEVAFPAVAVGHRRAHAHEPGGGQQQQKHSFIDGFLPGLRARRDVARTHRAALAERGRRDTRP